MVPHSPKEMVQPHLARRADVHRGAQAHGLQAAENFDRLRVVLVAALRRANHIFFVAHFFSWRSNFSRVPAARWTDPQQFGVRVRAQDSFCVKQGRRACGMIRTSPYPVIPVSPGESRTRRVPAPSHLAQRDVAKTHVSPGQWPRAPGAKPNFWVTFTWRTCRFEGDLKRIDNTVSIAQSKGILKAGGPDRAVCNAFVFYYLCFLLLVWAAFVVSSSFA